MKSIKTSKGIEIIIDMDTLYNQLQQNKNQLCKRDLILIADTIGFKVKEYKSKTDIFDDLIDSIYQSNYIDSMEKGYAQRS